jgi:hypothetical protein
MRTAYAKELLLNIFGGALRVALLVRWREILEDFGAMYLEAAPVLIELSAANGVPFADL